jgi:hypothetical protein
MYYLPMDDLPQSPLSAMDLTATAMHEWFVSLRNAGFSEEQAINLIIGSMPNNRGDGDM